MPTQEEIKKNPLPDNIKKAIREKAKIVKDNKIIRK